jgi:hypothetical protein
MSNIYDSRLNNAKEIFSKIKNYLSKGYMVWDDENYRVLKVYERTDSEGYWSFGTESEDGLCRIECYYHHPELDHGRFSTIEQFNEKFKAWKIVHPNDMQPLV